MRPALPDAVVNLNSIFYKFTTKDSWTNNIANNPQNLLFGKKVTPGSGGFHRLLDA